ncbi:RidA family protein [Arenibaculum pallidiluteum]|uniref:RidA family protein n=1 Tax=Arenibaculum pallidiluteum TaxID=2812559 RepID=UPI001A96EDCA|nr:RidA family protein [Arenibaculum pallidiluteum]
MTARTVLPASPEARLAALGLTLPPAPEPIANFVPCRRVGQLLFLSGQGPVHPDGTLCTGKVGAGVDVASAYDHARLTGVNLLAVMREALGSLDRVEAVVKLLGMVNAAPDFGEHPKVINGCSDLMMEVFGADGIHARSAVGVGSLPNRITVEIEAIVAVRD